LRASNNSTILLRRDRVFAFRLADVEKAVTDIAVEVLSARGEPARGERLLGEILVGLDRTGDLRRLTGTKTFAESEARGERALDALGSMAAASYLLGGTPNSDAPEEAEVEVAEPTGEPRAPGADDIASAAGSTSPAGSAAQARRDERAAGEARRPSDHVSMLLDLVVNREVKASGGLSKGIIFSANESAKT
jgi:hypothetical protein